MNKNLFVAFEGIDGSGKSTQAKLLATRFRQEGEKIYETFEPTNGPIGLLIRAILKGEQKADERVIAGLFVADRLDHLLNEETGIVRKINEGYTVICDRYCFSSYAYQGAHMSMDWVIAANAMSASILKPDVNVFVDVPPTECMQRISVGRQAVELYETAENLEIVRGKFFEAFKKLEATEKVFVVDGNRAATEVASDIFDYVDKMRSVNKMPNTIQ